MTSLSGGICSVDQAFLVAGTVGEARTFVARKIFGRRTFRWPGHSGAGTFDCWKFFVSGTVPLTSACSTCQREKV